MSIKRVWLDSRGLKQLREQVQYVASDDLKEELDDYLEEHKGEGAYLINVFSNYSIVELERLNDTVKIMPICFKI